MGRHPHLSGLHGGQRHEAQHQAEDARHRRRDQHGDLGLGQGFPASLDGAPALLPSKGTVLRRELDGWFNAHGIRPVITGEFDDSALLKVFGQAGAGFFAVPEVIADEVAQQYEVRRMGGTREVTEQFYAISVERRVRHPAVAAICEAARSELFV